MKTAIILGAGFAGCTIAYLLKNKGWEVKVLEKASHPGGGCKTLFYGGHPYTNGPRLYYGYSEKVFKWISKFVDMRDLDFQLRSYVESERRFFTYPIHEDDLPYMSKSKDIYRELEDIAKNKENNEKPKNFDEYWKSRVGETLYDMFVNEYSKKMWLLESNTEIDTFAWSAKDSPINKGSKAAYKGSYLAYPYGLNGYDPYFYKCLNGIDVKYRTAFKSLTEDKKGVVDENDETYQADIIISTLPIDQLLDYEYGTLPYAGRTFIPFVLPIEHIIPGDVLFLHYTQKEQYTRIVEYKKLTGFEDPNTLMVMELPASSKVGGKLYPYMIKKYINQANEYRKKLPDNILSIGRLGTYRYSTVEQTIAQAFQAYKGITGESIDGIENEFFQIGDTTIVSDRKNIDSNKE